MNEAGVVCLGGDWSRQLLLHRDPMAATDSAAQVKDTNQAAMRRHRSSLTITVTRMNEYFAGKS
jgi:hypothetical protein